MRLRFIEVLDELADREDVRCIIVGFSKVFSAGADMSSVRT